MTAPTSRLISSARLQPAPEDRGWLFDARRGALMSLNRSAFAIATALQQGADDKTIAAALTKRFGLAEELALIEVRAFAQRMKELLLAAE